ncbi:MAG: hypothetical protein V2I43_25040, partial [Parvularcula sp.]|nr:hypothetical protein [Parvularcula sp.]
SKAATGLFQNGRNFSLGGKAAVPLSGLRRGLDFDGLWVECGMSGFHTARPFGRSDSPALSAAWRTAATELAAMVSAKKPATMESTAICVQSKVDAPKWMLAYGKQSISLCHERRRSARSAVEWRAMVTACLATKWSLSPVLG